MYVRGFKFILLPIRRHKVDCQADGRGDTKENSHDEKLESLDIHVFFLGKVEVVLIVSTTATATASTRAVGTLSCRRAIVGIPAPTPRAGTTAIFAVIIQFRLDTVDAVSSFHRHAFLYRFNMHG
jgi:hypothetical protein